MARRWTVADGNEHNRQAHGFALFGALLCLLTLGLANAAFALSWDEINSMAARAFREQPAWADDPNTDTPTETPTSTPANTATFTRTPTDTPVDTPTPTTTATPIAAPQGALAQGYTCGAGGTCPTPPCDVPITLGTSSGHHTAVVHSRDPAGGTLGTGPTVKLLCRPAVGWLAPEVLVASLTGLSCDATAANCLKEFDTYCEETFLRVTACPTPAAIDGWLRGGQ